MYKRHKQLLIFSVVIAMLIGLWLRPIDDIGTLASLLAFFGILLGFTMTALVAMCGSTFMRTQALISSVEDGGLLMTNAQRVVSYLKCSMYSDIVASSIVMMCYVKVPLALREYVLRPLVSGSTVLVIVAATLVMKLVFRYLLESVQDEGKGKGKDGD